MVHFISGSKPHNDYFIEAINFIYGKHTGFIIYEGTTTSME